MDVKLDRCLDDINISYVKVVFGSAKDAKKVKSHLKGKWIEDK